MYVDKRKTEFPKVVSAWKTNEERRSKPSNNGLTSDASYSENAALIFHPSNALSGISTSLLDICSGNFPIFNPES